MIFTPILFMLLAGTLYALRPRESRWLHLFFVALFWEPILFLMVKGLHRITSLSSARYDEYFYLSDRFLGLPSFSLGRIVATYSWLKDLLTTDYLGYVFIAFCVVGLNFALGGISRGYRAQIALMLAPGLAPLGYAVLPASGPGFAFTGYPYTLPAITTPHIIHLQSFPNCFPSGHLSMALICAVFLWRWRLGKVFGCVHVLLTILATLGLGEHYLIDLIAAVPYTLGILWLTNKERSKKLHFSLDTAQRERAIYASMTKV